MAHRRFTIVTLLAVATLVGPFAARDAGARDVTVEVAGLEGDLERNALAILGIAKAADDDKSNDAQIRRLHDRAPDEIKAALEPFGYYQPLIQAELATGAQQWVATYTVNPGPVLRLESVDVQLVGPGAADPALTRVVAEFPLKTGDPAAHPAYELGKSRLVAAAAENGYLDATFVSHALVVDLERYFARVVIRLETGPQYRFGPVEFRQDVLDPDVLRGYVRFEQGAPLDYAELTSFQDALSQSAYFRRVEVQPRRDLASGAELPIVVELVPNKRQKFTAGVGYGTDTGPHARSGVELRRLNRRGHRATVQGVASGIEMSGEAQYEIPWPYPRTDRLTFSGGYADLHNETSKSKAVRGRVALSRILGGWQQVQGLTYQRENFAIGPDTGIRVFTIPEMSWSTVLANDRLDPRFGTRLRLDVQGAERHVFSDATFLRLVAETKTVQSLGTAIRFIGRLEVGTTFTDSFRRLPPLLRFFAGGAQSVRGYPYNGLGPRDGGAEVIGGEHLVVGSVETEYRIFGPYGLAVFYDTGNALHRFGDPLESGAGAGLRWLSPVGMVRLDGAWPISDLDRPMRFHLTVGPDL